MSKLRVAKKNLIILCTENAHLRRKGLLSSPAEDFFICIFAWSPEHAHVIMTTFLLKIITVRHFLQNSAYLW